MKPIVQVLQLMLPGCVAVGLIALGQFVYQISGTGSDASKMTGTATVTLAAPAPPAGPRII